MRLTIVGNTVVDLVFPGVSRLPTWPRHTEFTPSNLVLLHRAPVVTLGGNGANAAFVAASCGAAVALHTLLGDDDLGRLARGWLQDAGCSVQSARQSGGTAVNVTAANSRHHRATFFFPGARPVLPALRRRNNEVTAMLVCGWPHPPLVDIAGTFQSVRQCGGLTALDTGPILGRPWSLKSLKTVFENLDLLLTNDHEVKALARERRLDTAVRTLRATFAGDIVVKRGGKGVSWWRAGTDTVLKLPARRVRVINTVGAGDAFNGALLAGICQGLDFPKALRRATVVAASVVASPRGVLGVKAPPR